MTTRHWIVPIVCLVVLIGCNTGSRPDQNAPASGSNGSGSSSTTGSSSTQPPSSTPGPRLLTAELEDVDGSQTVNEGDEIVLTFEADCDLQPGAQPSDIVRTVVNGDSFGQGPTILPGTDRRRKKLRLGRDPILRVSGAFDPSDTDAGAASGIDLEPSPPLVGTNGSPVRATSTVDLEGPFQAGFLSAGHLTYARGLHSATLLDDDRVLVVGGVKDGANGEYEAHSEIFDPQTGTFTPLDRLSGDDGFMEGWNDLDVVRFGHTATKLDDGRVLIAGGYGVERKERHWVFWQREVEEDLRSGHIFDPQSNAFHRVANRLSIGRSFHTATKLDDGRVLIAGGHNGSLYQSGWWIFSSTSAGTVSTVEVFDPVTERFSPLGGHARRNMIEDRMGHTAMAVDGDQHVYLVGGARIAQGSDPEMTNTSELYLGTPTLSSRATLNQARWFHTATELPNGETLIAGGHEVSSSSGGSGGSGGSPSGDTLTSLEMYDPQADAFSTAGDLDVPRARHAAAPLGDSGDVLFVGGVSGYAGNSSIEADVAEIYDVSTGQVDDAGQLIYPRNSHTCTTLADGRILIIGGFVGGSSITSIDGMSIGQAEIFSME